MFKKTTVPAFLALVLASCSPTVTSNATEAPATTAAPTTTAVAPTTAAPNTAAPTTAAPTTAAPTTEAPATTEAAETGATATAGEADVIAISGVGAPIPSDASFAELDAIGMTADPVETFIKFGGNDIFPFPSVEGGRLIALRLATGDTVLWRFSYLVANPNGQSVEELATAASAAIKERYPDYSEATSNRTDGTTSSYGIELMGDDYSSADWQLTAASDSERPEVAVINFEVSGSGEDRPTGEALIPPVYKDVVAPYLTESKLEADKVIKGTADAGLSFGTVDSKIDLDFSLPDVSYADAVDSLRHLGDAGYKVDDSNSEYTVFDGGNGYRDGYFQVINRDDSDSLETTVIFQLRVDE